MDSQKRGIISRNVFKQSRKTVISKDQNQHLFFFFFAKYFRGLG